MTIVEFISSDPFRKIQYIEREIVKTILTLGYYDGPGMGIVGHQGDKYLAYSPDDDYEPRRFLMVKMSEEQASELIEHKGKSDFLDVRGRVLNELTSTGTIYGFFTDWFDEKDPVK